MSLEFRHIAHAYGTVQALHDVSFIAPAGEITCLLGPSGCGKSTLLGLAAGLLDVQHGSIWAGGEILADPRRAPPPERRDVGLVFQDGALFPHMTLFGNVAFGLARGERGTAERWLERVGLEGLGNRYPHELSGGQQQRAALARAVARQPQVMLMDEPFASVDIVLRRRLRRDCRLLLRERGTTTLLVTHDPNEALDVADRIAVIDAGRIVQVGAPADLSDRPATASIGAMFAGAQIVRAERGEGGLRTPFGIWPPSCLASDLPAGNTFDLLIDPARITLEPDDEGYRLRDYRDWGSMVQVVLFGEGNAELISQAAAPIARDDCYRPVPERGSVRAFAVS